MNIKEFKELPRGARNLIIYYTLTVPFLITVDLLPVYLFRLGFTVEEVGIVFSITSFVSLIASIILGVAFDRGLPVKIGMLLIEILESLSNLFYALATKVEHILIGNALSKVGNLFGVSYQVYEKDVYPSDKLEKVYSYHFALPELMLLFSYPIIGYLLGFVFTSVEAMRLVFLISSLSSLFFAAYILKLLPDVFRKVKLREKSELSRELWPVIVAQVLIVFSFSITTGIVLDNYIYNILGLNIFFVIVVTAIASSSSLVASIVAEKINTDRRFQMLILSIIILVVYACSMANLGFLNMSQYYIFGILLGLTILMGFGHTLWFIFHRSYLFRLIPEERRGAILGGISSLTRVLGVIAPATAGIIAYRIHPLATYYIQVIVLAVAALMYMLSRRINYKSNLHTNK